MATHVRIASLDDLLAHKLKVLLQRVETKDYADIAAMLRAGRSLNRGLEAAMALFPNFPSCEAVKALVYFQDSNLRDLSAEDRATLILHAGKIATQKPLPLRCLSTPGCNQSSFSMLPATSVWRAPWKGRRRTDKGAPKNVVQLVVPT